eukprot:752899-Hanusia_phi.AAC.1
MLVIEEKVTRAPVVVVWSMARIASSRACRAGAISWTGRARDLSDMPLDNDLVQLNAKMVAYMSKTEAR